MGKHHFRFMPSFFNGKRFFLTYPQTSHESATHLITYLRTRGELVGYVIGKELHENGDPHLHACVEYESTVRGNERLFDFQGRHPNVQSPRNWAACKTYCKKDKNFEEWSLPSAEIARLRVLLLLLEILIALEPGLA